MNVSPNNRDTGHGKELNYLRRTCSVSPTGLKKIVLYVRGTLFSILFLRDESS
jgi:hypothetical protein